MAHSSKAFSHSKLIWITEWRVRGETLSGGSQPFTKIWGDGDTSSSDGQFFSAGGHGEARADYNAKYGSRPLLEYVCRRRLADEPNVQVQPRAGVVAIVAAEGGAVAGVRCEDSNGHVQPQYFAEIQEYLAAPWAMAVTDFVQPETRGERPQDLEQRLRYGAALVRLAAQDAEVHKILAEVNALLKPHGALREPTLASRVTALMETA